MRTTAQEVLLDFIARDKHQKLVTNLRQEDVEVLEDGVPQTLRSFQYRGGRGESGPESGLASGDTGAGAASSPDREINLVSLVFQGLGAASRREAAQAAKGLLANDLDPDTYAGVFVLTNRLALLQQYTNDPDLLYKAVDRAMGGAHQQFVKEMEAEVAKLNRLSAPPDRFQANDPGSAEERGPQTPDHFTGSERQMARMTLDALTGYAGNLSIDALQKLIEAQAQLPGRKTVIYFAEGLMLPSEEPERFRAAVSAANRASVTFYTVDPSGLSAASPLRLSGTGRLSTGLNRGKENDPKENLRNLAEETGGFAISDTNDARMALRHVMEEVRAHYEVAYAPTSSNYDGHFRTIEMRARKPGIRLQGRKGYFALPLLGGESLAPFEFDALKALNSQPSPHAFDFHAGVLTFRAAADATECRAVFSVPSRALHFKGDAPFFHIHAAFLALVKDEQDQVVRKISRDLLFQAPSEKRAEFERGEVTVMLPLSLPPGRYRLEAVVKDVEGAAASTRKIALVVPSAGALSDLVLVRRVEPVEDRDFTDPLEFSGGKVTPEMKATVSRSNGAGEGVYFVLYPGTGASGDVRIAVTHNGKAVNLVRPSLPPAGADGSLRVLSGIPFSGFDPGVYEVTVTAGSARRTAVIEVQ